MSLRSISSLALTGVQLILGGSVLVEGGAPSCPSNGQLSCHNSTEVSNTCCFLSPGGQLLQTQFWDTNPQTGPSDSWTIHGLWPDHCDGSFDAYCDQSRNYKNITQILESFQAYDLLDYMNTYWPDYQGDNENFWEHEWGKHGTCISTYDTSCYTDYRPQQEVVDFFNKTTQVFQTLDSYKFLSDAGITPSSSTTYSLDDINNALRNARGVSATVQCRNGELDEIWYHFNIQGSVQSGEFVPAEPDGAKGSCPDTVKYLPKSGDGGSSTTSAPVTSSTFPAATTSSSFSATTSSSAGYDGDYYGYY